MDKFESLEAEADNLFDEGNYAEALNRYIELQEEYRVEDLDNVIGDCLYYLGEYKEAVKYYEKNINGNPYSKVNLGKIYYYGLAGTEDKEQAIKIFDRAGCYYNDYDLACIMYNAYTDGFVVKRDLNKASKYARLKSFAKNNSR